MSRNTRKHDQLTKRINKLTTEIRGLWPTAYMEAHPDLERLTPRKHEQLKNRRFKLEELLKTLLEERHWVAVACEDEAGIPSMGPCSYIGPC